MGYSFSNLDKDYHVRELAGIIGVDPGNLSRELKKLEIEGLYKVVIRGKLKIYSIDKNYPLFKELKQIMQKTEGIENKLKLLVNKYKEIQTAFIYGSFAKGNENKMSDIDIIITGKSDPKGFVQEIRKLELLFSREINYTFYSDSDFRKERQNKGGFLNIVLKNNINMLKGDL